MVQKLFVDFLIEELPSNPYGLNLEVVISKVKFSALRYEQHCEIFGFLLFGGIWEIATSNTLVHERWSSKIKDDHKSYQDD